MSAGSYKQGLKETAVSDYCSSVIGWFWGWIHLNGQALRCMQTFPGSSQGSLSRPGWEKTPAWNPGKTLPVSVR